MHNQMRLSATQTQSAQPSSLVRARSSQGSIDRAQMGNQAMQQQLRSGVIQAKLTVSQSNDQYEQEADRVAESVMRMPDVSSKGVGTSAEPPLVQRKCTECEEEEVQRKTQAGSEQAGSDFSHPTSGGQALPAAERNFFEPRFGQDFSHVRVHADAQAGEAARSVSALAYTMGSDVVFGEGHYKPGTDSGRTLLAHELAHVVQQGGGSPTFGVGAAAPRVQRLVRTSSVTCPAAATGIANPHTGSADRRASSLLATAITRITNAQAVRAASPADPDVVAVGGALNTVFHLNPGVEDSWTGAAPNVRLPVILRRLQAAQSYIDSVVFTINCIPNGGAGYTIPGCANGLCGAGTEAFSCHSNPTEIVLCPDFWALGLNQRGRTWMHEVMHIAFGFINDWGQPNVHNAHCYAQFVALLNSFDSPPGFRCP
jgi:hypothetical protein